MKTNAELYELLISKLNSLDYIKPEDIPSIDLYMDQVTTFMDDHLKSCKRYPDDKVMTKTMINNYAKNNLLPPPVKKKYSKEHMLLLTFIYYFKNLICINDIQTLFSPLCEKHFNPEDEMDLEVLYREVFSMEKDQMLRLMSDVKSKFHRAQHTFAHASEEDREQLQLFSFICLLSFDVYLKKNMIETLIDEMRNDNSEKESHKKASKKEE